MQKPEITQKLHTLLNEILALKDRLQRGADMEMEIAVLEQQAVEVYRAIQSYKTAPAGIQQPAPSLQRPEFRKPVVQREQLVGETVKPEVKHEEQPVKAPEPVVEKAPEAAKSIIEEVPATNAKPEPEIEVVTPPQAPQVQKKSISEMYADARQATSTTEKKGASLNDKLQSNKQASLNEKLATGQVKKNLAEKLKLSPITDLKSAINLNQRISFINHLFGGDDKAFKKALAFVSDSKNFSEAKYYLQSEPAAQYKWNNDSELVQEFMELVYRKFL